MSRDPHGTPQSAFFRRWAELVLRHRLLVLLFVAGVTVAALLVTRARLRIDMTIEAFLDSDSPALTALEQYRDQFGRDAAFIVMIEGDVFSAPYLARLKRLHDELANLDVKIESLGERLLDRKRARTHPPATSAPAAGAAKRAGEQLPARRADDDDFSGFDDGDSATAGQQRVGNAAGWGDETGGTIVDEITSLVNFRRTRGYRIERDDGSAGFGIKVGELLTPWPAPGELPALRAEVLADPTLVGNVVGKAGRHSLIAIRAQFMAESDSERVAEHIKQLVKKHQRDDFRISVLGMPVLTADLNRLLLSDMQVLLVIALLVLALLMFVIFRHPVGVFGPMSIVLLSIAWTFGAMSSLDLPMTMLTNILPAFLICVGVGDSVHLLSIYRDYRRDGYDNREAIISALGSTGKPVLFTTLTTAVGLLSFQFATINAIRAMGLVGALGVTAALLLTLLLLPIILSLNSKSHLGAQPRTATRVDRLDRWLDFCASRSGPGLYGPRDDTPRPASRRATLLVALGLTVVALFGASRLRVWHDPLSWIPPGNPTRGAFERMDSQIGGTANVQLLFRTKGARGVKNLEFLRALERLDSHIHRYRDGRFDFKIVGNSVSLLDIVKETYRALHGGDQRYYRLPQTQGLLDDTLFLFSQSGPEQFRRMVTTDMKNTQMTIRVRWLEATSYGGLTEHINAGIEKFFPSGAVEVLPTGSAYTVFSTVSSLIMNIIRSFAAALVVITLLMMALLGEVRLGLISMVPNLLPIVLIVGAMGYLGVPVDMANLLIASIAIGVAVDDTIHLLHHFKLHFRINREMEPAIRHAFGHAGRAMLSTSVILAAGFYVYLAGSMISIIRFGALMGSTVLLALLVDLIFTPALVRTLYRYNGKARREPGDAGGNP